MNGGKTYEELLAENERLRWQLDEATETIQAIRTGQVDALVVEGSNGHELYTLKTSDYTYRIFIETMNEGAVTLNKDGLILYCNSTFASMVDLPLSKVIGLAFDQFVAPDCKREFDSLFSSGWGNNRKIEFTLRSTAEKQVHCQLSATAIELDGGLCLSMVLTDLTAQKETQQLLKVNNQQLAKANTALQISNQALNRSNDNLQQFAYIASHDLQEPLRKIQAFGDLLKTKHTAQLGEGIDYIERMQSAASRMSILIKDLLTFSRISIQPETTLPVPLSQLIDPILTDLEMAIDESGAVIDLEPLPTVSGDPSQLRQLFQNLISNAIKFRRSDVSPHIRIGSKLLAASDLPSSVKPTHEAASYHRIDVQDNGIGFETKYLDRIFQVFQRLYGKNQYPGTGIGLAICEKVAANHGGAITAASQLGEGATFSVYLPA
ncbi:sensor histidine kinase [Spirosoma agri]|uniref:histidine kinase n=1 Tax=Spirosoma agri TaxID=1987381 RepID=A0A6M0IJG8_9BACT|nr:ATP-binding protein [Spirosoma agri]NEU68354.1 PAS domain-containing protein [Spirosoma agri]